METIETVPLAAYESQASRFSRIVKWLIMGWAISVVALGLVLVISLSYSEEVVTETQTYERYAQADNQGNAIVGDGDISIGDSANNTDGYEDEEDDQTGASVANSD